MWNRSALVEVLCCNCRSDFTSTTYGVPKKATRGWKVATIPEMSCRAISMADPTPLSTAWLLGQIKRILNPGRAEAAISSGCQPSKESKPSRKPLQPTLWECHCMIARNPHAAFFVCGDFDKSLCCSLSMITIYKLRSQVLSLGLKCTDRSQWSLAVSGQDLRASVLGSTAIVEYHV